MQPVIRPMNKADHGSGNHEAKLVNSNGQWLDHSSAEEIGINDRRKWDPDKNEFEEISDITPGRPRTPRPREPDVLNSVGSHGGSLDC